MKFDVTYNNGNACPDFIRYISQSLISINVKSKLKRVNFITVLCDGAKDAAIIEKECVFVLFVDPDNFTPSMIWYQWFFSCKRWYQCKQWFKKWTHYSISGKWFKLGCICMVCISLSRACSKV